MKALVLKVKDVRDLARLAGALERVPKPILSIREGDAYLFIAFGDKVSDYSIFFSCKSKRISHYILYRVDSRGERVEFLNKVGEEKAIYIPIIHLNKMPKVLEKAERRELVSYLEPIEVENLPSLVKLSLYKYYYDEQNIPLFLSIEENEFYIGAIAQVTESDDQGFYFYVKVREIPEDACFVKVDMVDVENVKFTDRVEGHGYHYIKLIKLEDSIGIRC